ncbi:MAG: hypothetical protein Q7T07_03735 [Burkholderiaceae bacterium]|nr:hypothetical protein [Burkholderiaceae bacterium]
MVDSWVFADIAVYPPSLRAQRGNPGAMDRHGLRPRDDEGE